MSPPPNSLDSVTTVAPDGTLQIDESIAASSSVDRREDEEAQRLAEEYGLEFSRHPSFPGCRTTFFAAFPWN